MVGSSVPTQSFSAASVADLSISAGVSGTNRAGEGSVQVRVGPCCSELILSFGSGIGIGGIVPVPGVVPVPSKKVTFEAPAAVATPSQIARW